LLRELLVSLFGNLGVHPGQDAVQILQHRYLGTQPRPHGAQLETNDACPNHDQVFGNGIVGERLGAGADHVTVHFDAGQRCDLASRCDEDVLGGDGRLTLCPLNDHLPRSSDATVPEQTRYLVLLEQAVDPARQFTYHAFLAAQHRVEIQTDLAYLDTKVGEGRLGFVIVLTCFEERLAGDTPHAQTRPTEATLTLDARDLESELRSTNRGGVPAGSGPNHHQIEMVRHNGT
jgi:hypothetical protein